MTGVVVKNTVICNFMAIALAEVKLDQRGLVFIEGENLDDTSAASNGAGKSSLVDAISWCFYGVTARGVSGDAVVNRKAGRNCSVMTEVEVDGVLWRIDRGRKDKILKNRVRLSVYSPTSGEWEDHTLGTDKLTQERIDALMGCNAKTFNDAVYMGQENMVDLPNMTDKVLKSTLEQALNLDRLDEAQSIANMRLDNALASHRVRLADLEGITAEIEAKADKMKSEDATRVFMEHDIRKIEDEIKVANDEKDVVIQNAREQAELMRGLVQKAEDWVKKANEECNQITAIDYEGQIEKLDNNSHKLIDMIGDLRAERNRLKTLLADPTECPTCLRHFDDHEHMVAQKAVHQAELEKVVATTEKVMAKHAELLTVRDKLVKESASIKEARRANLKTALNALNVARDNAERADAELSKAMSDDKTKTLHRWLNEKEARRLQAKRQMEDLILEIDSLKEQSDKIREMLVESQDRIDTLERVKHVLSRKGFRGEVLDQITPYLNARTQYYLTWLTSDNISAIWNTVAVNANGDLSENFHIKVAHREGAESFEGLSGGEKRKVRLACAMALQDLVGTRAVKPIKLFIADEIDDAIDESGLELLMGLLEEKAKSVGTLMIISHNALGDWCKESITVTKKDGVTTIK